MGWGSKLKDIGKDAVGSAKKFAKDPKRVALAAATAGQSESWRTLAEQFADANAGGDAAKGLRAAESKRQQGIQARINVLRASYGEGDSQSATAARAGIDRYLAQLESDGLDDGTTQASDAYQGDLRAIQDSMYARGLTGGSADLMARRQALTQFVANRQKALSAARGATDAARTALRQQRQDTERLVAQGTQADPSWTLTAASRDNQIQGAWRNAWSNAVGSGFAGAGALTASAIDERSRREPVNT